MPLEDGRISELRATAHPLRLQMLSLLTGAELSAAEVARELGISQANASYHLRLLHDAGLLVIASEESVRGGRAKRYRHVWDAPPVRAWGEPVDEAEAQHYVRVLADAIPARFADRRPASPGPGSPNSPNSRSGTHLTDADLWVSPEVWARVVDLLGEASALLHASAQPPRSEGTLRASLSVAAFELRAERRGAR
jgi:DNA-binding transcriptional ArsR family regulator